VPLAASDVTPVIGHGVQGVIEGKHYRIGSARWLELAQEENAAQGLTIYLADEHGLLARFILADTLRPDAGALIQAFKEAGLQTTILTGDGSDQADMLARELGVDELVKGVTPDGKLAYLKAREAAGDILIMVGDGINDAPVLAGAHASFCHGGGTDLAKNSADAILLADDLSRLLAARALALRTRKIIKENFAWSIGYNLLCCRWRRGWLPLSGGCWHVPELPHRGHQLHAAQPVSSHLASSRWRHLLPRRWFIPFHHRVRAMNIIFVLIPIAILFVVIAGAVFFWAIPPSSSRISTGRATSCLTRSSALPPNNKQNRKNRPHDQQP
jgi:Cu2+-exporting ATPase